MGERSSLLLVLGAILAAPSAIRAEPPEVSGVRFDSAAALAWNAQPSGTLYHVYRGEVDGLPSYGSCLLGSLTTNGGTVTENPAAGLSFFYLVTAVDESGEGTAGTAPPRTPASPCVPVRRAFAQTSNGDPGDGVEDGTEPRRNAAAMSWSPDGEGTQIDNVPTEQFSLNFPKVKHRGSRGLLTGVDLHTGEFFLHAVDLEIPGRGFPLRLSRSYHSQRSYDGPLGHGWDASFNARLAPLGNDVLFFDGTGRRERFFRQDATHFVSPTGLYAVLRENPDGAFSLRFPDGTIVDFHAFDGSNVSGAVEAVADRNANRMAFLYDTRGLLTRIVDTLGRDVELEYDSNGRVTTLRDFVGREIVYTYDAAGDLVASRSPVVTGTPNGNDFPLGKTTQYTYVDHDLLTVIRPNELGSGIPAIENVYDTATGFSFDRVTSQSIGGTTAGSPPAGGTLSYAWESLNAGGDPADRTLPRRRATVLDRNGNRIESVANVAGNPISITRFTNREVRPGEPDYTTQFAYNEDGEVVEVIRPLADRVQLTWDAPAADRFREGNLLELRRVADTFGSGGRGNGRGGEIADLVRTWTYEPVFNRVASTTEPRGNDPAYLPQNGGPNSPARYTERWFYDYEEGAPATNGIAALAARFEIDLTSARANLGDRNGDTRTDQAGGNLVRVEMPAVRLAPGSRQAAIEGDTTQEIVTLHVWNDFGQRTATVDAEQNRHELSYYPESDPDGDGTASPPPLDGRVLSSIEGGWLATVRIDTSAASDRDNKTDPPPADIRTDHRYDPAGNVVGTIDGRGVLTRVVVNALDQPVEVRRAAATADASGPDGDPATGRGETGLSAFSLKVRFEYDADDNVVLREVEDRGQDRNVGPWVGTTYAYDILGNLVRLEREATATLALTTLYGHDANENATSIAEPEGTVHARLYDERDLLFRSTRGAGGPRGGSPSSRTFSYDGDGNPVLVVDGRGYPTDFLHDGFNRRVLEVDEVGNRTDLFHDPAGQVVRERRRGPVGGPTPPDRTGSGNEDLADVEWSYDELGRIFRRDRKLFLPVGVVPLRGPLLEEGDLDPADGFVSRIYEYDKLSRPTFLLRDTLATFRHDYDGAGRPLRETLPDGSLVDMTHDASDNLIETAETELSSAPGTGAELFLTTYFHDALNRLVLAVDPLGESTRRDYDSLDAVLHESDANGPPGGSILRRSPGHTGITVAVNGHGNVTSRHRDGAGRLVSTERTLTASGRGDGTLSPTPDTSNAANPDGKVTTSVAWDGNSLPSGIADDRGNTTTFLYDNLNRLLRRTADDGTKTESVYDAEDHRVQVTDANGSVFTHTYDPAGRLIETAVARATGIEGATQQTFAYDGRHLLTRATHDNDPTDPNDDSEVRLLYDSLGREIEESQRLSGVSGAKVVDLAWRGEDLVTRLTYPSGREIAYGHDGADRLVSVADLDSSRTEATNLDWFGYSRVHTRTLGNGVVTTMLDAAGADVGFDGARRVVDLRHRDSTGTLLAGFEYTYDAVGNRLSERRPHHADPTGPDFVGELWRFDSSNRLIGFEEGTLDASHQLVGSPADAMAWTLDGPGNWAGMTRNGASYAFTFNNLNEYDEAQSGDTRVDDGTPDDVLDPVSTSVADGLNHAHDKNGALTDEGNYRIVYDAFGRPVRAIRKSGSIVAADYDYDAFGRLVRRIVINSGSLDETRTYAHAPAAPTPRMKGDFSRGHEPIRKGK